MAQSGDRSSVRRRTVLQSLAVGGSVGSVGCMRRLRAATGWQSPRSVSLEIKTFPSDADPYALRVARSVAEGFRTAGLDVTVSPMAPEELFRQVLLQNEFDAFVARTPTGLQNPDALFALLHSRFEAEPGWQNPFGYANLDVDDGLERQRTADEQTRRNVLAAVQRTVARTQPFSVVVFPDDIRAARSDRFVGWNRIDYESPFGYLALEEASSTSPDGGKTADATLRLVMSDRRVTENLNPLAVEFRRAGILTGLLYDPLGYERESGRVDPWLADGWEFTDQSDDSQARVRLRSGVTWHDGEPLTPEDVAFTYEMLSDVTLDRTEDGTGDQARTTESDAPVAVPRFRGRSTLVDDARAVDTRTVEFTFNNCSPAVATRAFTLPVFPEHVWTERLEPAFGGEFAFDSAPEALVTNNIPPVGSGPFAFDGNTPGERLALERFDQHFLVRDPPVRLPDRLVDGPPFDRVEVLAVGPDETAVSVVANDEGDVTGTAVDVVTIPRIGRSADVDLVVNRSSAPYIVGYNTRRSPLTNPRFRNTLAQLIDQKSLAADVFGGYAWPAVSPLDGTDLVPEDLQWEGENPVTPFLGSDGTVDASAARAAFRDAGYNYDDGTLVERN